MAANPPCFESHRPGPDGHLLVVVWAVRGVVAKTLKMVVLR